MSKVHRNRNSENELLAFVFDRVFARIIEKTCNFFVFLFPTQARCIKKIQNTLCEYEYDPKCFISNNLSCFVFQLFKRHFIFEVSV